MIDAATQAAIDSLPTEVFTSVSVYERDDRLTLYRLSSASNQNGLYSSKRTFEQYGARYAGKNTKRFRGRIVWEVIE